MIKPLTIKIVKSEIVEDIRGIDEYARNILRTPISLFV